MKEYIFPLQMVRQLFSSNKWNVLFSSFSELPVKILGKTDAKIEKQFLVSDDIILVCELSRANASVSWYKDDKLIDDNERYCIEEQGVFRSLVVLNAAFEDSGKYTCDAVDDKMVFYITVKGNINNKYLTTCLFFMLNTK